MKRFWASRRASFAVGAALLISLIMLMAGSAVDITRAVNERQELQKRLDAAVIAAARARVDTVAEREALAATFVGAGYDRAAAPEVTLNVDGLVYTARARHEIETGIARVFGYSSMAVDVRSTIALQPPEDIDIALALDNTVSMAGAKLDGLKIAARDLARSVLTEPGVRLSVVPFARYVNVGMGARGAAGLAIPADDAGHSQCTTTEVIAQTNCRSEESTCTDQSCTPYTGTCVIDGLASACTQNTCTTSAPYSCMKPVCDSTPTGTFETSCTQVDVETWYGCMGSREAPLNARADADGTGIPGVMNVGCGTPMLRLGRDLTAIEATIDAMTAADNTYIAPGLLWAWRSLTHTLPFADGIDPAGNPRARKILILMSDGINTISKTAGSSYHTGTDQTQSNDLMADLCTAISAEGVEVFTVAYDLLDVDGRARLRDCASDPDTMFFDARDTDDLIEAFEAIFERLYRISIAS